MNKTFLAILNIKSVVVNGVRYASKKIGKFRRVKTDRSY